MAPHTSVGGLARAEQTWGQFTGRDVAEQAWKMTQNVTERASRLEHDTERNRKGSFVL